MRFYRGRKVIAITGALFAVLRVREKDLMRVLA